MKKIFIFVTVLIVLNTNQLLSYSSDPKLFVKELIEEANKVLSDKSLPQEKKNEVIEIIAKDNVDIKALGLYTLGTIRKSLDKNKLYEYGIVFEKYFLKSLTSRLSEYSNQRFEIVNSEQKSSNYTIVSSKIAADNNTPEIKIDWRIYTKNPDKPLIRDLIVEGLSLAKTQKEEFGSILNSNNNDIDVLIKKLEEFVLE